MQKLIQSIINKIIADKKFSDNYDEMYLYLLMNIAVLFAGVMHVLLFFLMLIMGVNPFTLFNIISILIYGGLFILLIARRMYRLVGLVISGEVIFYSLLALIYFGGNCCFFLYLFLLLLIQINIPYAKASFRVVISVAIFIALTASAVIGFRIEPIYEFQNQTGLMIFSVSNCVLSFFGILIELFAINIIRTSHDERVKKYENRAHTDSLTGIHNRWYADGFIASFSEEKENKHWCVAMIDVDDFKKINDSKGHSVGDRVLQTLVDILSASLRKTDVLFRWGGEEFLVFLPDVELKTAAVMLDIARKRIADTPVFAANTRVEYTVTIGVADVNFNNVQGSIAACDERMYYGKQIGKNRVII